MSPNPLPRSDFLHLLAELEHLFGLWWCLPTHLVEYGTVVYPSDILSRKPSVIPSIAEQDICRYPFTTLRKQTEKVKRIHISSYHLDYLPGRDMGVWRIRIQVEDVVESVVVEIALFGVCSRVRAMCCLVYASDFDPKERIRNDMIPGEVG